MTAFTYLLHGVAATLALTVSAFLIGAAGGVPIALAARSGTALRILARAYVELMRSIPPLVWLFLIFFGFPQTGISMSPFQAATLTFGLIASAYLAEIYRAGIGAVGRGQWDAADALGLTATDSYRYVISPQVLRVVGPTMATYGIGLLKDSALASTIGVVELTFRAGAEAQRTGQGLTVFATVGVIYIVISLPLAALSRQVDSRLRARFSVA